MIATKLIIALRDKFGLDQINKHIKHHHHQQQHQSSSVDNNNNIHHQQLNDKDKLELIKLINYWKKCLCMKIINLFHKNTNTNINKSLTIDLCKLYDPIPYTTVDSNNNSDNIETEIFTSTSHENNHNKKRKFPPNPSSSQQRYYEIPIKLELGSGTGEWITQQAAADYYNHDSTSTTASLQKQVVPRGLWIGLELKCDRVHQMTQQVLLSTSFTMNMNMNNSTNNNSDGNNNNTMTSSQSSTQNNNTTSITFNNNKKFTRYNHKTNNNNNKNSRDSSHNNNTNTSTATSANNMDLDIYKMSCNYTTGNLAILGGDAHIILRSYLPTASISAVFVNHPEPPEQRLTTGSGIGSSENSSSSSGNGSSQGLGHMLTKECFIYLYHVLKENGTITIVTDNLPYGQLLIDILHELAKGSVKNHIANSNQDDEMNRDKWAAFESVMFQDDGNDDSDVDVARNRVLEYEKHINITARSNSNNNNNILVNAATRDDMSETDKKVDKVKTSDINNRNNIHIAHNVNHSNDDSSDNSDSDSDSDSDGENENEKIQVQSIINKSLINSNNTPSNDFTNSKNKHNEKSTKNDISAATRTETAPKLQLWKCIGTSGSGTSHSSDGSTLLEAAGHVVESSSYFDRLWKKGDKKKRYLIYIKKLKIN